CATLPPGWSWIVVPCRWRVSGPSVTHVIVAAVARSAPAADAIAVQTRGLVVAVGTPLPGAHPLALVDGPGVLPERGHHAAARGRRVVGVVWADGPGIVHGSLAGRQL